MCKFFLGKHEADEADMSLVYHYSRKLFLYYRNDAVVLPKVKKYWDFLKKDIHGLVYLLTPKYASSNFFSKFRDDKKPRVN